MVNNGDVYAFMRFGPSFLALGAEYRVPPSAKFKVHGSKFKGAGGRGCRMLNDRDDYMWDITSSITSAISGSADSITVPSLRCL
jgi:hypothetical protein